MLPEISFVNLALVAAVAFLAPLLLGLLPWLRLPAVLLEILAGVALGPAGLGLVQVDLPVQIMALLGLAFLLFLAGLELDLAQLRGPALRLALAGFLLSLVLALGVSYGLGAVGLLDAPLFVAIVLAATALGVVIGVLKDAGHAATPFGQFVLVASSLADVATVVLLALFFSRGMSGPLAQLVLLGGLALLAAAIALVMLGAVRWVRLTAALQRLQDTTAQIRVRGALLLLLLFVAMAEALGLEVILGAFLAGALLSALDQDRAMTHPVFRRKLEAVGFGVFIPAFFVASGLRFNLGSLLGAPAALGLIPLFLGALLLVRGLPALLAWRQLGPRQSAAAGLLQATSLSFIVAATQIGVELGVLAEATGAALTAAGLLSVVIFPAMALVLVRGRAPVQPAPDEARQAEPQAA